MISVMILIGSIPLLQSLLFGRTFLPIIFNLLAVALYCTALFFEKIHQSVLAVHILIGIVVLLLSVTYCCINSELNPLLLFITLNATLALSVCTIFVAVILKGLSVRGLIAFTLLAVFFEFIGILFLSLHRLANPYY
ncbi:unnamed protein product, partial [Trichobilharzia szidati]